MNLYWQPKVLTRSLSSALILVIHSIPTAHAFDYFEHRYLGNEAYEQALLDCKNSTCKDTSTIEALNKVGQQFFGFGSAVTKESLLSTDLLAALPLQFGDLCALAGDFTEDETDLKHVAEEINRVFLEPKYFASRKEKRVDAIIRSTRRQWFSACKWIYRHRDGGSRNKLGLDGCFSSLPNDSGFDSEPNHLVASQGYHAAREELASFEAVPSYVSLASQNGNHFGRFSWKTYSRYHRNALSLADEYRKYSSPDMSAKYSLLANIIVNEAFAQHFLHDSFAAGHMGSATSECLIESIGFGCFPTKHRLMQTHDTLNEIGLNVQISMPIPYVWQSDSELTDKLTSGWTAFGDDHLFIKEADFHRAVILKTAAQSIREVLARLGESGTAQNACHMCYSGIFPFPRDRYLLSDESQFLGNKNLDNDYRAGDLVEFRREEDLYLEVRSKDARIPGIPVEGWKIGTGYAQQKLGAGSTKSETGIMIKLDYMRNIEPFRPNVYGIEFWSLPDLRTSYLVVVGYSWPREVTPYNVSVKLKGGWRTEENFTPYNSSSQRINGLEVAFPSLELTYELFPPMTFFLQATYGTWVFHKSDHTFEGTSQVNSVIGVRFDLSGI